MTSGNFIVDFLTLNKNSEVPPIFALWSAIGGISSVLGRGTYLDMGRYTIYPNEYILLVAGSGTMRKSTAIRQVQKIVTHLTPPPNMISQMLTPQAFFEALKSTTVTGSLISQNSTGFAYIDELATFLNRKSYEDGLAPLLISAWDCVDTLDYHTRGRGKEELKNVSFGFLAASTIDWIRSGIPPEAVGAGLTSRILFVYADERITPVAITSYSETEKQLQESLLRQMMKISSLCGEVELTPGAWKLYEQKYNDWYLTSGLPMFEDSTLSGYASRRFIHMLKLSIIYAAASLSLYSSTGILVTEQHIHGAITTLLEVERHMKYVMNLITCSEQGLNNLLVVRILKRYKTIRRSELIRLVSNRLNSRELSEILETLIHSDQVLLRASSNTASYTWVGKD